MMINIPVRSLAFVAITLLSTALPVDAVTSQDFNHQDISKSQEQAFDVISVRPSDPNEKGSSIRPNPDEFSMKGTTLKFLIQVAYDVHDFQVEGGPGWMESEKFDVQGKMDQPTGATLDRKAKNNLLQLRVQNLLKERFKLRLHQTSKELPVLGLLVAKGGPKLQAATKNEGYSMATAMYKCTYSSMSDLAWMLSSSLDRIVIDETNLNGPYAFTLRWTPDETIDPDGKLPGLFTAIEEQLGLKLVSKKGSVQIIVVDSVDKASSN